MATQNATQDFVPIKEIRDGIVVLKGGGLRAIVLASSINLSLKSFDEQQAVLMQFQSFLNSLDFSTQIVIQSRRLDIRPYLMILEKRYEEQTEPLLKIQTKEYIEFIRQFTEDVAIMTKNFYIVVPYSGNLITNSKKGLFSSLFASKSENKQMEMADFEEQRTQLEQRVASIQQGLARMGVKSSQLKTDAVIEVFYKFFNPGDNNRAVSVE
ncbi:MAG: hypothetical protein WCO58_02535 [bacterium]